MCNDQLTIKCTKLTLCAVVISMGRLMKANTFTWDVSRFHYVIGTSYLLHIMLLMSSSCVIIS